MPRDINNPSENYYLILGLDYEKPETDPAVIEAAIKKKKQEWSNSLNNPQKAKIAQKNLAEIPNMEKILLLKDLSGDELAEGQNIRKQEADAARKFVNTVIGNAIRVLDEQVNEARITALVSAVNKKNSLSISVEVFRKKVEAAGIKITSGESKSVDAPAPKLDSVTRKNIENYLATVQKNNIYEFLGLSDKCSSEDLGNVANQTYLTFSKKDKNNPANVASSELAGICVTISKDQKKRDAYDEYLKEKQLDVIKTDVEYATDGVESLSVTQTDNFVQQIMNKMKCSQDVAIGYLRKFCNSKCAIEISKELTSSVVYVRCGICGTVVKKGITRNCPDCGTALEVACPQCGTVNETTNNSCTKCGYSFKNAFIAKKYIDDAFKCMETMDLDAAESKLNLAKHYDSTNKDIAALEENIKNARSVVGNSIGEIETLISEKKFFAAKNEIINLERKVSGIPLDSYKTTVKAALREAASWYEKAQSASSEKDIIEYASRALGVCSDHPDARATMMSHPPVPISNFRGKTTDSSILLRWNESPSEGVVYVLVRKGNAVPQHEKDGINLGEYSSASAEDKTAEPGKQYYYTIFTSRAGILSPGVSTQTPLCCYSNLTEVSFIGSDKSAIISWTLPENAEGVEIWRQQDSAPERGDGKKIPSSGKSVEDTGLDNGKTYYYSVFVMYRCNGSVVYSSGITGKVSPSEPVKPIDSFDIKKLETNVFGIKWGPLEKGNLVLYYSKDKKSFSRGEMHERSHIEASLSILPTVFKNEEKAKASVEENAIYHVYPVIYNGEVGTFCSKFILNNVADISGLQEPSVNNDSIYLKFTWPSKADRVFVTYKAEEYAKSFDDPSAECEICTKDQFDAHGGVTIKGVERRNYYITVYAVYGDEEPPVCSGGVKSIAYNRPQTEVSYSVKAKKGLFAKKNTFVLTVEPKEKCSLPKMKLVRKNGQYPPLNVNDGICVANIDLNGTNNSFTYEFSDSFFGTSCFKLFFENEDDYMLYKLMALSTKDVTVSK